jgi:hypothetical protein
MGWIVFMVLVVLWAVFSFGLAGLGLAMGGKPNEAKSAWKALGFCLVIFTVPVWFWLVWPINALGYRVPYLGAPFGLGGRGRSEE